MVDNGVACFTVGAQIWVSLEFNGYDSFEITFYFLMCMESDL